MMSVRIVHRRPAPGCTAALLQSERGFALPFTIFLVTIITIMLAAAFTRTTAEHLIARNSASEVSALALAQSGLQDYLANPPTTRPDAADSVRYNYPGGFAQVHPELVYTPEDTSSGFTYIVRSVGNLLNPDSGGAPIATRTIAQFARWRGGDMPGVAALVAVNGVNHEDLPSHLPTVTWFDGDDQSCVTPPTVVGATLGYRGPAATDQGNDPGTHDVGSASPTQRLEGDETDIGEELGIDWEAATTDSILNPDYTNLVNDPNFPTIFIDGNETLDVSGTGLLVVTGNLTVWDVDDVQWNGLILIGGELRPVPTAGGTTRIYGMVVTGLNRLEGAGVDPNPLDMPSPALQIHYSSCAVRRALEPFVGFHTVRNTWIDNWATY